MSLRLTAFVAACALFMASPAQAVDEGSEQPVLVAVPHVFIARTDGSDVRLLTPGAWPAWSPDGSRIAFHRWEPAVGGYSLHTIDSGGAHSQWLAPGLEPAWSPDGMRIAFSSLEGIGVLDLTDFSIGTVVRHDHPELPTAAAGGADVLGYTVPIGKPTWSPNGARIAFEYFGDTNILPHQIHLVNADGSNVQRVTPPYGLSSAESDPAWSPDGQKLALWSYGAGLVTVALGNGTATTLYSDLTTIGPGARPSWSPDGSLIAFVVNGWSADERSIWIVASGGGSPFEFIPGGYDPAWSPDGNSIAFVSDLDLPVQNWPPVTRAARVYDRETPHANPPAAMSRYVLYEDGTFELRYVLSGGETFSYSGTFERTGSEIALEFAPEDSEPEAIGTFSADEHRLEVKYDLMMQMSDFEDGIYVLSVHSPEGPVKDPDEPYDPPPTPSPCPPDCVPDEEPGRDRDWRER